ncbi:MAG: hypothetical protein ABIN61_06550 [candidate division WOR-3 bacterium]
MEKFHKFVLIELLSTIDHKVRGVQQFIVALRGLIDEEILNDLEEETKELQEVYENYLKYRALNLEKIEIGKFLEDFYNIKVNKTCFLEIDKERFKFIFDSLIEMCENQFELSIEVFEESCLINFISPFLKKFYLKDFRELPDRIELLPLFAVNKTITRMGGEIKLKDDKVSIELPRSE